MKWSKRTDTAVFKTSGPPQPSPQWPTMKARRWQRIAGDSRQVAQLATGTDPVILTTHHGTGHFVVDTLDEAPRSGSQLVYNDGPFTCRSLINAGDRPRTRAVRRSGRPLDDRDDLASRRPAPGRPRTAPRL